MPLLAPSLPMPPPSLFRPIPTRTFNQKYQWCQAMYVKKGLIFSRYSQIWQDPPSQRGWTGEAWWLCLFCFVVFFSVFYFVTNEKINGVDFSQLGRTRWHAAIQGERTSSKHRIWGSTWRALVGDDINIRGPASWTSTVAGAPWGRNVVCWGIFP